MHLYRTVLGTYHLGMIAAHSESEAIEVALHNVLPGLHGERLEYERDVAFAELIEPGQFVKPTVII